MMSAVRRLRRWPHCRCLPLDAIWRRYGHATPQRRRHITLTLAEKKVTPLLMAIAICHIAAEVEICYTLQRGCHATPGEVWPALRHTLLQYTLYTAMLIMSLANRWPRHASHFFSVTPRHASYYMLICCCSHFLRYSGIYALCR